MPHPDPLADAVRVVIDGSNLQGALRRAGGGLPEMALVSRLMAAVGASTRVVVVFDGARPPGVIVPGRSSRLEVRWSRHESADDLIARIVAGTPAGTLVITDDGDLRARVRRSGADPLPSRLLVGRFGQQRTGAPTAGRARSAPPAPAERSLGDDGTDEKERRAWQPGRGATRKKGNPKRGHPAR